MERPLSLLRGPVLPDPEFRIDGEKVFSIVFLGCMKIDLGHLERKMNDRLEQIDFGILEYIAVFGFVFSDSNGNEMPVGFGEPFGDFSIRVRFDKNDPVEPDVLSAFVEPEGFGVALRPPINGPGPIPNCLP